MSKITYSHDAFFRLAMDNLQVAREFFEAHLPAHLLQVTQLETLQLCKESFVDEDLKLSITDMLYEVRIQHKPGYVYLLVEHQNQPDYWMPFRLLRYILLIIERHRDQHKTKHFPIVYPLVFYNGKVNYRYSTDLFDLFDDKALAKDIFLQPFQLIDLNNIPDEVIRQRTWSGILELAMKHIYARDIQPYLQEFVTLFNRLEGSKAEGYIYSVLVYLLDHCETQDKQQFVQGG